MRLRPWRYSGYPRWAYLRQRTLCDERRPMRIVLRPARRRMWWWL
jgi:hypothetical protein